MGKSGMLLLCMLVFAQIQMSLCLHSSKMGFGEILFSCLSILLKRSVSTDFPSLENWLLSTARPSLGRKYLEGSCEGQQFHLDKEGLRNPTSGISSGLVPL